MLILRMKPRSIFDIDFALFGSVSYEGSQIVPLIGPAVSERIGTVEYTLTLRGQSEEPIGTRSFIFARDPKGVGSLEKVLAIGSVDFSRSEAGRPHVVVSVDGRTDHIIEFSSENDASADFLIAGAIVHSLVGYLELPTLTQQLTLIKPERMR